jgi:hypothetical protein
LRSEIFDLAFFSHSLNSEITVKVYETEIDPYKNVMRISDNMDYLSFQGIENPMLFCSEVIFSMEVFKDSNFLANINVAEKYRVLSRKMQVFNYQKLLEIDSEVFYFKICLKDLISNCQKLSFYTNKTQGFDMITTQSMVMRLERKQIISGDLS